MVLSIDPYYINTFRITLLEGRDFDENIGSDTLSSCIINETLAKQIGLENPINAVIQHDNWYITMFPVSNIQIIGVVKDFHFKSFRNVIQPMMLAWNKDWHSYLNIKIADGRIAPAMKKIREVINEFAPNVPLEYQFIDESFDRMYKSDERMSKIIIYFTMLAILISVLGLVGIITFSAEQRKKEVAIRKVLGASIVSINQTLSKELTIIVIVANIIGWPLVVWLGSKWLNEFVYKTTITPHIFIVGAIISITIALITILSITTRTANLNPAESLRCE
jgi:putative ABC transport system permease protein